MRIVIASDSFAPKIDGVADTAGIVARALAGRGHAVCAIAPAPGPARADGYRIARIASLPLPTYPELRVSTALGAVGRLLRAQRPDVAVVLTPGPIGMAVARALPAGARLVNIYTTDIPRYLAAYGFAFLREPAERLLRWMAGRAVATLCPTEVVRRELAARGYPRLIVWGRGVDCSLFDPRRRSPAVRLRLTGGEPEKPLVLYVGRLAREKRLLDLHAAARRLPGARFALVGDGPQRDLLERRFADVPSVFAGYLRGEPLAQAFASADLFAFPSDTETFGQVVLQAMAAGVPPIVPRGSAPAEFVPDGVAGVHVPPRDPMALAGALAALIADTDRRVALARGARGQAERFSWDALVDRLEALFGGAGERTALGAS